MTSVQTRKDRPFIDPYLSFWKNSFKLRGKTRRTEFWEASIVSAIPIVIALLLGNLATKTDQQSLFSIMFISIFNFISFASIIPQLSIGVRRLRDSGKSPYWIFLYIVNFIPLVGLISSIALFVMYCQPSKETSSTNKLVGSRQDLL